ncbi:MAG: ABC transporter permease [Proteobacteria bacterium]|nr:ABC transporter permease [Pseudomonadota bacterium]
MMPGDPFLFLSGDQGEQISAYSDEQIRQYKACYGLDQPIFRSYLSYLADLFRGRLGQSLYFNESVGHIVLRRLPWTVFLVCGAILFSTVLGTALGSLSAFYRNRLLDNVLYGFMMFFSEIPAFLIGLFFLFVFAASLGLFPLSGALTSFSPDRSVVQVLKDIIHHAVLPVAALSLTRLGGMYLLVRNIMISIIPKAYMRTARAKGLSRYRIFIRHGLRNALLPLTTRIFMSLGTLVGGAVLVENVFAYPGLGLMISQAVMVHDYPLIQGIFLVITLLVLSANLMSEVLYRVLDPRVKDGEG